jgi:hypothetical protein
MRSGRFTRRARPFPPDPAPSSFRVATTPSTPRTLRDPETRPECGQRVLLPAVATCVAMRSKTHVSAAMRGDWRGFQYAWQTPDPERDEGPGLTWRQLTPRRWSGTWESKIRGTVTRDGRRLDRIRPPRGPARAIADHDCRPVRHCQGSAGGGRRGLGGEVTTLAASGPGPRFPWHLDSENARCNLSPRRVCSTPLLGTTAVTLLTRGPACLSRQSQTPLSLWAYRPSGPHASGLPR